MLICLNAVWGSIVTINNPQAFQKLDHTILFQWLVSSGLTNMNLSLWIYILIFLIFIFALNTAACTADRIITIVLTRRPWHTISPQLVHIGFLIALLGHLIGSVYGFRSQGNLLVEGKNMPVPYHDGLLLRLDGVDTEISENGELNSIETKVTLLYGDSEVASKSITINGPLIYKGTAFYHVNHGNTVTGVRIEIDKRDVKVDFGQGFGTPDGKQRFMLGRIIPDFAIDYRGLPYSRSNMYRNPHVEVLSSTGSSGWLPLSIGASIRVDDHTISLRDHIVSSYAIINIYKDPGIWFIIAGSTVLTLGMILSLFFRGRHVELMRRPA